LKLLLDQGLPRSTVNFLRPSGVEARHIGDLGLSAAEDAALLERARQRDEVIVTLDSDFHALLALSGAARPSVIRLRVEGLRGEQLAALLVRILERCGKELESGALVTVTESNVRLRRLPLVR
jgi:predicted nuclease of predicted toxin-antitoxin system